MRRALRARTEIGLLDVHPEGPVRRGASPVRGVVTRSIIGIQSPINPGLPNRVVALRSGTIGWTLAGFRSAPGSQLVQETDWFAPVRGALVVLADVGGGRVAMTASWLAQMGWDADGP